MFYADDTQLYITVKPSTPELAIDSLSSCIKAVFDWNTCNRLQTNRGKTEVLRLTSRFVKNPSLGPQFIVAGVPVNITSKIRNLGVTMEALWIEISHEKQKNVICGIIYRQHNSPDQFIEYFNDTTEKLASTVSPINVIKTINVIPTINVIKIDHKCNTNHKCNNF